MTKWIRGQKGARSAPVLPCGVCNRNPRRPPARGTSIMSLSSIRPQPVRDHDNRLDLSGAVLILLFILVGAVQAAA